MKDEAEPGQCVPSANLAIIEKVYRDWAATSGGNVDDIIALMSDSVVKRSVMSIEEGGELGGTKQGKAAMRAYFETLVRDWELIEAPVERLIDGGGDIVMVGRCHWRSRDGGIEFDIPKIDVWRFEDGLIVEFYEAFDTAAVVKAIGSAPPPPEREETN